MISPLMEGYEPQQELPQGVFTGFQTASNKALPPPSAAALLRAQRLLQDEDESPRKRPRHAGYIGSEEGADVPSKDPSISHSVGFATASGRALPPPSKAAQERAAAMLAADNYTSDNIFADQAPPSTPLPPRSGFSTASGKSVAPPSKEAQERVAAMLSASPRLSSGFATASGRPVATPSQAAQDAAATLLASPLQSKSATPGLSATPSAPRQTAEPATGQGVPLPSQTGRNRVNLFAKPAPLHAESTPVRGFASASGRAAPATKATREAAAALFGETFVTPVRTPLQPKHPSNTGSPAVRGKPISITPSSQRRAGMGLSAKGAKKFVAPFKRVTTAPPRTPQAPAPVQSPIFDLSIPDKRKSYRQAYLKPQYMTIQELEDLDIPPEIWQIDTSNAAFYHFDTGEGEFGCKHAKLQLERCGATPSEKWVNYHWALILWKLAGIVQAQPNLIDELWTFDEATRQLKYRYEREIGNAQRPLIRRIQEHDSSPSLAMVLCVVAIHRPPAQKNDKGEATPVLPHLELTDGWYRILAQLDVCLARAVDKGKIVIGRKLGITGARLDGGADGAEVMDAFDKSRLILSGNSTSLARWDTKLGMQSLPFIATLNSLSRDGGIITMMDVVVDKIFPLAFRSADWNVKEGEWDQEEETQRQNKWKETYEAEAQKLQDQMQQSMQPIQDLVDMLQGDDADVGPEPVDLEDRFEALLTSPVPSLARTPSHMVPHLARYAVQYLEREAAVQHAETHAALQASCPARDIRDFRLIRFTDANSNIAPTRIGMLKVWDAKALGGGLEEGKRYMVTNLMPTKNGNWTKRSGSLGEVYLQTRRDTRWQIME